MRQPSNRKWTALAALYNPAEMTHSLTQRKLWVSLLLWHLIVMAVNFVCLLLWLLGMLKMFLFGFLGGATKLRKMSYFKPASGVLRLCWMS